METLKIAVVDDHILFRKGLISLIQSLDEAFEICMECNNGQEFIAALTQQKNLPDIAILDLNMPQMDGFETAEQLKNRFPSVKTLVLTMDNDEQSLIRMLRLGVKGYLGKDVEPAELHKAIKALHQKGFHYTDILTGRLIQSLVEPSEVEQAIGTLKERELDFIRLACSEDTYERIADKMCVSPKTVDGYRAAVFDKLNVRSRVGLAIYAIKNQLFEV